MVAPPPPPPLVEQKVTGSTFCSRWWIFTVNWLAGTTSSPAHGQRDRETSGQTDCGTDRTCDSGEWVFLLLSSRFPEGTKDSSPQLLESGAPTGGRQQDRVEKPGKLYLQICTKFVSSTNIVHKNIWLLFWCEISTQSFLVSAIYGFQNVSNVVTAPPGVPGGGRPCRPRTTTGTWGASGRSSRASTRTNI